MYDRYLEYLEEIKQLTDAGVLKNHVPMSFEEWHREDYKDRIESYWMQEHGGRLFCEECWEDFDDDGDGEISDQLYHSLMDLIENCYESKESIPNAANRVAKIFRSNSYLEINKNNFK